MGKSRVKALEEELDLIHAELEHTQLELKQALQESAGALYLVARIREALGDNGKRMQDELIEYCKELAGLNNRTAAGLAMAYRDVRQDERNHCIETMYYLDWPEKGHSLASYRKAMEEKLGSL